MGKEKEEAESVVIAMKKVAISSFTCNLIRELVVSLVNIIALWILRLTFKEENDI